MLGSQMLSAQSRRHERADRLIDAIASPGHELQADRPVLSVRDSGEAGVPEVGPPELKADGLGDLQLAGALDKHPALAKIQDAITAAPAPTGAPAGRRVFGDASTRNLAGEPGPAAGRGTAGGARIARRPGRAFPNMQKAILASNARVLWHPCGIRTPLSLLS